MYGFLWPAVMEALSLHRIIRSKQQMASSISKYFIHWVFMVGHLRLATEKATMTNLWPHPVISQKAGYDFGLEDIPEEARVYFIPIFWREHFGHHWRILVERVILCNCIMYCIFCYNSIFAIIFAPSCTQPSRPYPKVCLVASRKWKLLAFNLNQA